MADAWLIPPGLISYLHASLDCICQINLHGLGRNGGGNNEKETKSLSQNQLKNKK